MISILIVDDQKLIHEILQTKLEIEADFRVIGHANDGREAVQKIELLQPDVVLMDIEMNEMNGLNAISAIKNHFSPMRIIILSSKTDASSLSIASKLGIQSYLLKDINQLDNLVNTIRFVHQKNNQKNSRSLDKIVPEPSVNNSFHEDSNKIRFQRFSVQLSRKLLKKIRLYNLKLIWGVTFLLALTLLNLFKDGLNYNGLLTSSVANSDEKRKSKLKSNNLSAQRLLPVKAVKFTPIDSYQESSFYTGIIVPNRVSELKFEYPGNIVNILVEEGTKVIAGSPLASLDSKELEAKQKKIQARQAQAVFKLNEMQSGARQETIMAAKARVRVLEEQLTLAVSKSLRRENLYVEGAISREQFDENVSNKITIQARLDEAQSQLDELLVGTRSEQINAQKFLIKEIDANLDNLKIQLEKRVLKAPFSGFVSHRLVDKGTVVDSNQAVVRLIEDKALQARIAVPVDVANQVSLNSYQQLKIRQKNYRAKVSFFLPEVDLKTRTLTIVLTLDKSIGEIFPGQTVKLELNKNISSIGYSIPSSALTRGTRGLWSCYVIGNSIKLESSKSEKAFRVEQRDVEVLQVQNERAIVRGNIKKGERVIISGSSSGIVPKQLVRLIDLESEKSGEK